MKPLNLATALLLLLAMPGHADDILIGTGSKSGVYYQVGRSICRLLNREVDGLSCEPLETAGSVANLANVTGGSLEIGIVQSDIQYHAVNNSGPYRFIDTPHDNLRALFSLYVEPFNLVARRDAGISGLDDLRGHRINVGNIGSGHRATMEVVMQAKGWTADGFPLMTDLPASQQTMALCHDRVQSMVYTAGHPNHSIAQAIELCDAILVDVSGPEIDRLVAENPFYTYTSIPVGIYPGMDRPIRTFGTLATVVSSSDVDDALVYTTVKALFENLDRFKRMHLAFRDLDPEAMISKGLAAPLHSGAERYFREMGWIQ
jgi:TRAP transporter TAXI family solute receptor